VDGEADSPDGDPVGVPVSAFVSGVGASVGNWPFTCDMATINITHAMDFESLTIVG
jgi:hypothetical protein